MSYALVVEYLPSEALQKNIDKPETQSLKEFKDYRLLKNAMHSLMNLDLRQFSSDMVFSENLPRHLIAAAIVDSKLQVVANIRMLEQFENIKMPQGIYLQIDKSIFSIEEFERKADFPVATYSAHGPRLDYFLLREKADLTMKTKQLKLIKRYVKREVKRNSDTKNKI